MSIQVSNLRCGETVGYSLPLLTGDVQPPLTQGTISVVNPQTHHTLTWPVFNGVFKALVPLAQGTNHIELKFYDETLEFVLLYQVPPISRFVRPIYIQCCDDDGSFQGLETEDLSSVSAQRRIALGAKLLQTFTAEKLFEHGLGRRTFVLETDLYPASPPCHIFRTKLRTLEAQTMCGGDLWMYFARELMSSKLFKDKELCKWYTFMSFTRYDPPAGVVPKSHTDILKYTKGHTALGGGGLALFGTGNLHTWAEHLDELIIRFTDTRKIDRAVLMDDSAYRQYHWANYSTGLGASLHELGHTFDLAHTPTGVMARGFDDLYKLFTVQPLLSRGSYSRDSSYLASPVPYSPKQSPVHRPKSREPQEGSSDSRSGSPKPCPLSRPHLRNSLATTMPAVIQIETAFKRLSTESTQTFTVHNYDGSETKRVITRHKDGTETVKEVTMLRTGERLAKEVVKHIASGRSRTTMSMSTSNDSLAALAAAPVERNSQETSKPARLPKSPEEGASPLLNFQTVQYRDGGAHWYRASAVLLRFHKWFNPPRAGDPGKPPEMDRSVIHAATGLRLIELRSLPDGVVFHHWEFLQERPPKVFRLKHAEVKELSRNAKEITVVAEDDFGNILKKKVELGSLEEPRASPSESSL